MNKPSMDDGYRQRARTLQEQVVAQQQSFVTRLRQAQEWSMSNGLLTGGRDADSYRVRRDQVQQTQQQMDRLRQLSQRQGQGY